MPEPVSNASQAGVTARKHDGPDYGAALNEILRVPASDVQFTAELGKHQGKPVIDVSFEGNSKHQALDLGKREIAQIETIAKKYHVALRFGFYRPPN